MTDEAKKELAEIKRDYELLEAMKKSTVESDKKMAERIQDFLAKHLNLPKGQPFTLMDVAERAAD